MFARMRSLWRASRQRSSFELEMDEELRFHLEQRTDDLVRTGLTREAAARCARLEFGNPEAYQDRCRDAKRLTLLDDLVQDLRYAVRSFRRAPVVALGIVGTLTLAIGATTALFSIVNGVLLRPLPYPDPDRLLIAGTVGRGGQMWSIFGPDYLAWKARCTSCAEVAAVAGTGAANVSTGKEADRVVVSPVTANLFAAAGIQPVLGRTFLPEETGRPPFGGPSSSAPTTAVILGHAYWQRRFGGDPAAIGQTLDVDGDRCTIVGIMPEGFAFPTGAEAWVPAVINPRRDNAFLRIVVRVKPNATREHALAELQAEAARIDGETGEQNPTRVTAVPVHEVLVGNYRSSLWMFFGAVGFVLLIGCANVANLLLARAAARPREFGIRVSLGAGRSRLARQLLTESLLLAVIGSALGVIAAVWLVSGFVALAPADIPRLQDIHVDGTVLAFTAGLALATGLAFGIAPVLKLSKADAAAVLQEGTPRVAGSAAGNRLRKTLVALECALALILLIGGGLLIKSFNRLQQTESGFDPTGALSASVTVPRGNYPTVAQAATYYDRSLSAIAALPGVGAAGVISAPPLTRLGARISGSIRVEGESTDRRGVNARKLAASGGYFAAAGIPLLKGRTFDARDTAGAPSVVIVSASLARTLWPDRDPIGQRLHIGFRGESYRDVIGVVGDVKHDALAGESIPALYCAYAQLLDDRRWLMSDMTFVVRTTGAPEALAPSLRAALAGIDNRLPLYSVAVMSRVVSRHIAEPRFYAFLLGSFSLLAALLAAAGVYGVVAYSVGQRTHEIGVRMALGATLSTIRREVLRDGMTPVIVGAAAGLGGAYLLTGLLTRLLYHVDETDPGTFVVVAVTLVAVALGACAIPARRASRIDPIVALREQ